MEHPSVHRKVHVPEIAQISEGEVEGQDRITNNNPEDEKVTGMENEGFTIEMPEVKPEMENAKNIRTIAKVSIQK